MEFDTLKDEIAACRICAGPLCRHRDGACAEPGLLGGARARILVAGQAPGMRVHESGRPFTDPSGDRLRDWMGVDEATFYDRAGVAILPMAFCFPGL
jgi:uracil-DNA glycosylase